MRNWQSKMDINSHELLVITACFQAGNLAKGEKMTHNASPTSLLYKYVTISVLKKVLEGSIRFTQPSAFNDPLELLPEIIVPNDEKERTISVSFDIRAQRQSRSVEQNDAIPDGYGSSDAMSRGIVRQLNQIIGILSLSKTRDSLLMWAHYADQYSGAVITFDGTHDFFSDQIDIEYQSERPRRHLRDYLTGTPIPLAELCVKSDQWAYEKEVRIVRTLAECKHAGIDLRGFPIFVHEVPIDAIKSVILGERTPVVEQREIFARVMDSKISLSLAAIDHSRFAFRDEIIKLALPISQVGPMMSPRTAHIFSELQTKRGEFARRLINKGNPPALPGRQ